MSLSQSTLGERYRVKIITWLKEGYKAKAQEALEMGLISEVVSHEQLLARAQVGMPCRLQPAPDKHFRSSGRNGQERGENGG